MALRERKIVLALLAAGIAGGCRSFPYLVGLKSVPVEAAAPPVSRLESSGAYTRQLESGREIYIGQCARCHKPMPIQEFAMDDWTAEIIPRMAKKAKITPDETESLTAYVVAVKRLQSTTR
jgi:mono/diheme cytochrome c family protein